MIYMANSVANAEPLTPAGYLSTHEEGELSSAQDIAEAAPLPVKPTPPRPNIQGSTIDIFPSSELPKEGPLREDLFLPRL